MDKYHLPYPELHGYYNPHRNTSEDLEQQSLEERLYSCNRFRKGGLCFLPEINVQLSFTF